MDAALAALPDDVDALKAALLAARADVARVTAEAAAALAEKSSNLALIAHLKLQIEKLNRDRFGPRSERTARLLDQIELQLEELETTATENELAAEIAAAKTTSVAAFSRARPARRPFSEHLPRERVVVPGPVACACCGGTRLSGYTRLSSAACGNSHRHPKNVGTTSLSARWRLRPRNSWLTSTRLSFNDPGSDTGLARTAKGRVGSSLKSAHGSIPASGSFDATVNGIGEVGRVTQLTWVEV